MKHYFATMKHSFAGQESRGLSAVQLRTLARVSLIESLPPRIPDISSPPKRSKDVLEHFVHRAHRQANPPRSGPLHNAVGSLAHFEPTATGADVVPVDAVLKILEGIRVAFGDSVEVTSVEILCQDEERAAWKQD